MRIARKPTLLVMLALAATAFATPSAFAQTEPLAHNQTPQLVVVPEIHGATDATCPAVGPSPPPNPAPTATTGGCLTHASAAHVLLVEHITAGGIEVQISDCSFEVDIRINQSGEGYLVHQEYTGLANERDASCTRESCTADPPSGESKAWSFYIRELEPAPTERMTFIFCTEALDGSGISHCELTLPVTEPTHHAYRFTAADTSGHGAIFPHCEWGSVAFPAVFNTEAALGAFTEGGAEQRLEIRHQ